MRDTITPLPTENRGFRLRRRPEGRVTPADLERVIEPIPELTAGQALIRTEYISIDPSNRIWMSELRSYMPPVPLNAIMRGLGVGEVIASRQQDFPVGTQVMGWTGFQAYAVLDPATDEGPYTALPVHPDAPLTVYLGVLGHTGITAYLGLEDIGRPQPGETVVVSAAAGAVGSIAGQIAKARGARVVGIAGSDEKCAHVVNDLGFDACVNYKAPDWQDRFDAAVPDGVDVDFENVGGEIMDHVMLRLNLGARVVLCGMVSQYEASDATSRWDGQRSNGQLIMQRALMQGFLVLDHADRFSEAIEYLAELLGDGRLRHEETIVDGLEQTVDTINRLFDGTHTGKLLLRVR
jgi:NADPH-dependent curcumin reductase CurA